MKVRREGNISELEAARLAHRYGLLAQYIFCRRKGYSILASLSEWDLIP